MRVLFVSKASFTSLSHSSAIKGIRSLWYPEGRKDSSESCYISLYNKRVRNALSKFYSRVVNETRFGHIRLWTFGHILPQFPSRCKISIKVEYVESLHYLMTDLIAGGTYLRIVRVDFLEFDSVIFFSQGSNFFHSASVPHIRVVSHRYSCAHRGKHNKH